MKHQHNENGPESRANEPTGPEQHLDYEGEALMGNIQAGTTDSAFDPGEGWRRLPVDEIVEPGAEVINSSRGDGIRAWVRETPVPALPTEPYTVIRVTWADGDANERVLALHPADRWVDDPYWVMSQGNYFSAGELIAAVTGFEVLSEPRAVTAKAVLDRVMITGISGDAVAALYREFKAEF